MAAGPVIFLPVDCEPAALESWQLLKTPTLAQTALTAAQLSGTIRDISAADSTLAPEVIDVSQFQGILISVWAAAAANNTTFTLDLYGWSHGGPGHWISNIQLAIFGNFVSAANVGFHQSQYTHRSIRDKFVAGSDYQGVDTFIATIATYEPRVANATASNATVLPQNVEATDFPAVLQVNFSQNRYKYFGLLASAPSAGTPTFGAIFKPLAYRDRT